MPNALLIYPEFPPSYWGADFALEFVGKRSSMPPLGLLTVAALFPDHYDLRVIDMNVDSLSEIDLDWADYAFTSTMIVQKDSLAEVIQQCRQNGVKVIAGGHTLPHSIPKSKAWIILYSTKLKTSSSTFCSIWKMVRLNESIVLWVNLMSQKPYRLDTI